MKSSFFLCLPTAPAAVLLLVTATTGLSAERPNIIPIVAEPWMKQIAKTLTDPFKLFGIFRLSACS